MHRATLASLAACCLLPGLALAQQPPAGQAPQGAPPATAQADPAEGANEVVGLFAQTCLKYAGNAAALRSWLVQQQAPEMPAEMRSFFLGPRQGMVYDVSYQADRLALVSADDGSCSAYAEVADPAQTVQNLQQAMQEGQVPLTVQGDHPDQRDPSLQHRDYRATLAGRPYLVLVTTTAAAASGKVQAVITLRPA